MKKFLSYRHTLRGKYLSMCQQWLAVDTLLITFLICCWFGAATGNTFKYYFTVYFAVALKILRTSTFKTFYGINEKYTLTRQPKQLNVILKCEPFCTFLQIISFNEFRLLSDGEIFL